MMDSPTGPGIAHMNGSWVLDKEHSTGLEEVLKLQGIGWITRKAILASSVTLKITQHSEVTASSGDLVNSITLEQVLSSGLRGGPEKRLLDWSKSKYNDTLFGMVIIQSQYVSGLKDSNMKTQPVFIAATPGIDAGNETFLSEPAFIAGDTKGLEENIEEAFLHDFIRSEDSGWTAEQIWTVESVNTETVLTRRTVVAKGRQTQVARVLYRRSD
ncbi:hypothetical protein BJY01DRAFT_175687 [Aspergillus pseudoustus]|uniref:Uncharacterized protein n=1 Tax=Aspergillus pseudoustus TaxID=1810923 RepID=A0ABR4K276_9EURO